MIDKMHQAPAPVAPSVAFWYRLKLGFVSFDGRFEWFAACAGPAAFVALFRCKAGIIPVILACGRPDLLTR